MKANLSALCLAILLLLPLTSEGQNMWLGTNRIPAGQIVEFVLAPNARARMEAGKSGRKIDIIKGAVAVPDGFMPPASPSPVWCGSSCYSPRSECCRICSTA